MIPKGGAWWRDHAAAVVAAFPLAGTDWDQHSDAVDAGLYSVRNCSFGPAPAEVPMHNFADEPPLSLEEEESVYAELQPSQMELF